MLKARSVRNRLLSDSSSFAVEGISYDAYARFVDALGDRPIRVNFSDGTLEVMTISSDHEYFKKLFGRLVEATAEVAGTNIASFGSTTFRKKSLDKGAEPDECYYIANELKVRGNRRRLDLRRDPPPDLVIEINVSYHRVDREAIYLAMGVPEMWRFDGRRAEAFRNSRGGWSKIETSIAFPFLRPASLVRFVKMVPKIGETAMLKRYREWVGLQVQD